MNEPIKVFVSYSHQDDELRKELGKHLSGLERRKLIKLWLDRDIEAGLEWANEIDQNLEQAAIILLLVSADFIASEYCYSIEMTRAVARHEAGTAKVIPVIIGACDWTSAPFGKLQAIPPDNQAVATWGNGDKYARATAWTLVSQEISNVAQQIRDRRVAELAVQQQAKESFRSIAEERYQDGGFSYAAQELLRDAWTKLGLEESEAIEIQQMVQANLTRYFKVLVADLGDRSTLSAAQRQELKMLQSNLGISDGKAASLEQVALAERALKLPPTGTNLTRDTLATPHPSPLPQGEKGPGDEGLSMLSMGSLSRFELIPPSTTVVIDEPRSLEVNAVSQGNVNSPMTQAAKSFVEKLGERTSLEIVKIPGGSFQMGSLPGKGNDSERPQHKVQVPEFWMGKYPVTQAQWRFVASLPPEQTELDANPSAFEGDNRPVETVSWHQAVEFCQRLSRHSKNQYCLPSEAEWEYACRAKTLTDFYFGDVLTPELANFGGNVGETTDVGIYKPNAFGLYDMHGNVWEWCQDNWRDSYQGAPKDGSAWTKGNSDYKVLRGGSWFFIPSLCRSAARVNYNPDYRVSLVGFRVVSRARTL
jgi:formylglycine-generating enzyme required for sulfatase activity